MSMKTKLSARRLRIVSSMSLLATSVSLAPAAMAQAADDDAGASSRGGLEEIVVTAQKRGENLQKRLFG
jgi:outer membrane cobalamin receptor